MCWKPANEHIGNQTRENASTEEIIKKAINQEKGKTALLYRNAPNPNAKSMHQLLPTVANYFKKWQYIFTDNI